MDYQDKIIILIIVFILVVAVCTYIASKLGVDIKLESVQIKIGFLTLTPALIVLSWLAQLKWWGMLLVVSAGWLAGFAYFKILVKAKKHLDNGRKS